LCFFFDSSSLSALLTNCAKKVVESMWRLMSCATERLITHMSEVVVCSVAVSFVALENSQQTANKVVS
jgi:hypothetical protein